MTIQELMMKRFATKKFDPSKKVSKEDLDYILECARLSASSLNVQPWHVTVVKNPELRQKIAAASYGQPQVTEASHLLIFSVVRDIQPRLDITFEIIRKNAGEDKAGAWLKMVKGSVPSDETTRLHWLQRQSYLALQAMILAAIDRGIDSCPMEGFDPAKTAEILGMTDAVPTALLTLGYAAEPGHPKTRIEVKDFVKFVD